VLRMANAPRSRILLHRHAARDLPLGSNIPIPVGLQVLVGVGSLLVCFVASILLAIFLVVELTRENRQLSAHQVPYATAIDEAALAAKGAANDSRGFLISGNEIYIEEFAQRVSEARAALITASRHATTTSEINYTESAVARFERWVRAARREFSAFVAGHRNAAVANSLGPDRLIRKRYEASLAKARQLGQDAIRGRETSYAGSSRRAVTLLVVCLLATLAVGLTVTVWVVRKILQPVYAVLRLFADLRAPSTEGAPPRRFGRPPRELDYGSSGTHHAQARTWDARPARGRLASPHPSTRR
jgi:methyl-accepting chemotaxis protein